MGSEEEFGGVIVSGEQRKTRNFLAEEVSRVIVGVREGGGEEKSRRKGGRRDKNGERGTKIIIKKSNKKEM